MNLIQSFYFIEPKRTEVIHSSALTLPVMYRKGGRQLELQSGCHTSAILFVKFNIWSSERQRNNVIRDPVAQYHFKQPYKAILNYSQRPKKLYEPSLLRSFRAVDMILAIVVCQTQLLATKGKGLCNSSRNLMRFNPPCTVNFGYKILRYK